MNLIKYLFYLFLITYKISLQAQTVIDIDMITYKTIQVGEQIWMTENLKVKHYNDGTAIYLITDTYLWSKSETGAYCYYNNDSSFFTKYGLLYNGYVMNKNVCPTGWRIPDLNDWLALIKSTGGYKLAGGIVKAYDSTLWNKNNIIENQYNSFSAVPSGMRMQDGKFDGIMQMAYFWASDSSNNKKAISSFIENWDMNFNIIKNNKNRGLSIRCIKDN